MPRSSQPTLYKHIAEPLLKNLHKKLESHRYHDIWEVNELYTNNKGIDIISYQLELKFEGNPPIFISWDTVDGWLQYNLSVSETSFLEGINIYTKNDSYWNELTGSTLESFQVYGYDKNVVTFTDLDTGKKTMPIYYNEPHLLILQFTGNKILGIANFVLEKDFKPTLPIGDDVWILFEKSDCENFIKALSFDLLQIETPPEPGR